MTIALSTDLFLLVFMRMSGAILFNPLFGRNNVPMILKGAFSLICAYLISSTLNASSVSMNNIVQYAGACLLEFLTGLAIGVLIDCLFAVVQLAGELIDWQLGFSMASMYDPGSGISMPIIGSFFNVMLMVLFFASNAHLSLLSLFADSYRAIPPGTAFPTTQSAQFIVMMGKDMLEMGLRLALPILAVEIITELALGILMKAVPQINIFTIGIQLKALIGILMLLVTIPITATLCGRLSSYILEKCVELFRLMIHT